MKKDDTLYVTHIRDAISAIEKHCAGVSREEFMERRIIQSAVIRELEIIGEAAKNISDEYRNLHSDIPWKDIAGMRDKLIHGYFGVDLGLVWDTVQVKIPKLKEQIILLLS